MRAAAIGMLVGALAAPGCGEGTDVARAASAAPPPAPRADPAPPVAKPTQTGPRRTPLPELRGWTLDGQRFEASSLLGRRALLFLFNPTVREAAAPGAGGGAPSFAADEPHG